LISSQDTGETYRRSVYACGQNGDKPKRRQVKRNGDCPKRRQT